MTGSVTTKEVLGVTLVAHAAGSSMQQTNTRKRQPTHAWRMFNLIGVMHQHRKQQAARHAQL
ncbi:hypothetical protein FHY18_002818 [Xanthomonas arboricola]|uniref:hypothetical protein n=1 Tax=Xanthomonas sp. 3793 TaxID=3035312 RepID=UPI0021675AF9|nr:hypothetical protein [Xanthomonas sp. 3793]MCS3747207.1 hypothetical protein [Xanthomonas sp. 3793]